MKSEKFVAHLIIWFLQARLVTFEYYQNGCFAVLNFFLKQQTIKCYRHQLEVDYTTLKVCKLDRYT